MDKSHQQAVYKRGNVIKAISLVIMTQLIKIQKHPFPLPDWQILFPETKCW